jgi:hypothetical protein
MKCMVMKRIGVLVSAAIAACVLLPVFPVDALAQGFVTGSANTDGFSIVGWLCDIGNRLGRGNFTIIVHRDSVDGTTVAVVCNYEHFDDVVISGNTATFHSVGSCLALTDVGTLQAFTSDNTFTIVDKGEPGPDNDSVDVNLASGTGITIPGSLLVDGNFIVSPLTAGPTARDLWTLQGRLTVRAPSVALTTQPSECLREFPRPPGYAS